MPSSHGDERENIIEEERREGKVSLSINLFLFWTISSPALLPAPIPVLFFSIYSA
jgi:hypothetical protein